MNFRRYFHLLVASIILVLARGTIAAEEFRGIWIDAWGAGFMNKEEVTHLVQHCRTYNFNAVIVQMRRRGDAYYMPQAPNGEPRSRGLKKDFDALQELLEQCHAGEQRIEVHCWVPTHVVWSDKSPPKDPGHVFNRHPEFIMQNSAGEKYIGEGYYLDPGHPGATRWNYRMAQDIVSRYDIDGFHWDYIRYPAPDSGYNPTAIARYNAEFGLTGQPSPSDERFSEWRRRQVTDFLRWCNADLLAIKPKLILSCSVFGSRSDAFNARFQDWAAWNREGIIDLCMPMGYTPEMALFQARVTDAYENQGIRRVYQGQGSYLCTKEQTLDQLLYIRNKGLQGYVFYSYRVPQKGGGNRTETFELLQQNLQPRWIGTPTIPWKSNPANGLLKGIVTRVDTGAEVYNAVITLQNSRKQRSEAHGGYAFFELEPGDYVISGTAAGLGTGTAKATVTPGGVAMANVVLSTDDRVAPVITNVAVETVTDSSAVITWETDELSDSRIEYGAASAKEYSAFKFGSVLKHSIRLNGLLPATQHHFRPKSRDAAQNEIIGPELKFTTLPPGTVAEMIVDNAAARITGAWTAAASAPDKYGNDYRYKGKGTGAASMEFQTQILKAGTYDVYEWHTGGINRSMTAPHIVSYKGGAFSTNVNQRVLGGKWNLLGRFEFDPANPASVKITDQLSDEEKVIVTADAIRFVYVGSQTPR
jgi:uncharacterized lipoprotein YddW (UPF0748 family)